MIHRAFFVVGAGALAALYSCSDVRVRGAERAVLTSTDGSSVGGDGYTGGGSDGSGSDGSGSGSSGSGSGSDSGSGSSGSGSGSGSSGSGSDGSGSGSSGSGSGSAGSGSGSGSGSPQIRFRVAHSASNMRDAGAANARLDRLLADDLGGIGSLGYGGCAFDSATTTRSVFTGPVSISYSGDSTAGSFTTLLAQGSASAEIVCTSGPIPPPDTGAGSDTSSPGPESGPILDSPPAP
jgi:hypothetical protein